MTTLLDKLRSPLAGIIPGGGRGGKEGIDALREDIILGKVTQGYGHTGFENFHDGIDVVLPHGPSGEGAPVIHSPFSGRVALIKDDGRYGYGKHVIVRSAQGYEMLTGHQQDFQRITGDPNSQLRVGDDVWAGESIGHMGNTGNSTGAHVHYRLRGPHGESVDPTLGAPAAANDRGLGKNYGSNFWYADYHDLGFGQGDNPGQEWRNQAPSPTQLLPRPTTLVNGRLSPNPGTTEDDPPGPPGTDPGGGGGVIPVGENDCPQGNHTAVNAEGKCPPGYSTPDGFYMSEDDRRAAGCDCLAARGGIFGSNFDIDALLPTIGLVVLGVGIIIIGIVAFSHEQPVQAVVQPVVDTGKTVGKAAMVVAK